MPSRTSIFGNRIRSGSIPITALGGGVVTSSAQVRQLLPVGVVSSSLQFNTLTAPFTGSFTGSFVGTGVLSNAEILYYANI